MSDPGNPTDPAEPDVPVRREPADGLPDLITTTPQLADLAARLRRGHGPLAVDAERASGYRYSQRAYLVQLRRAGVGTALIDPISLPSLAVLGEAIGAEEWILHAANQDLSCLAELGLSPGALFDTELAGRLLGEERVALGTMVEQHLGVRLEKGHSAADWSTRPLPHDWLLYAALDVELLIELRNVLAEALREAGKAEWARQEFEAARVAPAPLPRSEPWRRTSGIHALRNPRQLATVRALWHARDEFAAQRDVAPGRILPDTAIVEAARRAPKQAADLAALPVFGGPRQRRQLSRWFEAISAADGLATDQLPQVASAESRDAIPAPSRWRDRDPEAAKRLGGCRAVITEIAENSKVLAQNLLASEIVRRLAWAPPQPVNASSVRVRLAELGARPWQVELTAERLAAVLG